MRARSVQGETLAASLALAAVALVIAGIAGYAAVGAALAIGLVLGAFNGFAIRSLLERRAPILPTAFMRLAVFTLTALLIARVTGWSIWPMVAGIGVAQLVMFGVGVRQGVRA